MESAVRNIRQHTHIVHLGINTILSVPSQATASVNSELITNSDEVFLSIGPDLHQQSWTHSHMSVIKSPSFRALFKTHSDSTH